MFETYSIMHSSHDTWVDTSTGDGREEVYAYTFGDDGAQVLTLKGREDVYLGIQQHASSCDINRLVERAQLDPTALNQVKGTFGDFTAMPNSLAGMFQMSEEAKSVFESYPPEFKEMFNNSFTEFWSQVGTTKFEDKFKDFESKVRDANFIKYKGQYYTPDELDKLVLVPQAKANGTLKEGENNE